MLTNSIYIKQLKQLKISLEREIKGVNSEIKTLGAIHNRVKNYPKNKKIIWLKDEQEKLKAHRKTLQRILKQVKRNLEAIENGQI